MDIGLWELLQSLPATSAAGMCGAGDGRRFIYFMASATSFWRYDTWHNGWQQLANPPAGGAFGAATNLQYDGTIGTQRANQIWGSVWLFLSSGTGAPGFARYDIATNTWSAALSVTNLPGTFGTVARIARPRHSTNNWESGITGESIITATAQANVGATTISVDPLPETLPSGAILNFGTSVTPLYAVLTASASAAAVSITVAPLLAQINSATTAYYYGHLWLWGNNATAGYRYNIAANTWHTTNVAGAAIAASPAALGADGQAEYLPGITPNTIAMVRAGATATMYTYDLSTNAWTTPTVAQGTETFTTGSAFAGFKIPGETKKRAFIGDRNSLLNHYALDPVSGTVVPWNVQFQFAYSTASAQDRIFVMECPDDPNVQFVYEWGTNNASFFRTPLLFNPFSST